MESSLLEFPCHFYCSYLAIRQVASGLVALEATERCEAPKRELAFSLSHNKNPRGKSFNRKAYYNRATIFITEVSVAYTEKFDFVPRPNHYFLLKCGRFDYILFICHAFSLKYGVKNRFCLLL